MGTNYYIVDKRSLNIENRIDNVLKEVNTEEFIDEVAEVIQNQYKKVISILDEEKLEEVKEKYVEKIKELAMNIYSETTYNINNILRITENNSIHIGKSSMGWLFNFQYQPQWKTYDEVKAFILDKEKMKDKVLVDEYGEEITPEELIEKIDFKQNDERNLNNPDNFTYSDNVNGYRFSKGDFS